MLAKSNKQPIVIALFSFRILGLNTLFNFSILWTFYILYVYIRLALFVDV